MPRTCVQFSSGVPTLVALTCRVGAIVRFGWVREPQEDPPPFEAIVYDDSRLLLLSRVGF